MTMTTIKTILSDERLVLFDRTSDGSPGAERSGVDARPSASSIILGRLMRAVANLSEFCSQYRQSVISWTWFRTLSARTSSTPSRNGSPTGDSFQAILAMEHIAR